jgi:hypothetical protein
VTWWIAYADEESTTHEITRNLSPPSFVSPNDRLF